MPLRVRRLRLQVRAIVEAARAEQPTLPPAELREVIEEILRELLADRPLALAIALMILDLLFDG